MPLSAASSVCQNLSRCVPPGHTGFPGTAQAPSGGRAGLLPAGRLAQAGPRGPGLPPMDTEPQKPASRIHPLNSACSVLKKGGERLSGAGPQPRGPERNDPRSSEFTCKLAGHTGEGRKGSQRHKCSQKGRRGWGGDGRKHFFPTENQKLALQTVFSRAHTSVYSSIQQITSSRWMLARWGGYCTPN